MHRSDIARFRQEHTKQEQAARQGLYGLAIVAAHHTITARMEQAAPTLVQLLRAGNVEQCNHIIAAMQTELGQRQQEDTHA